MLCYAHIYLNMLEISHINRYYHRASAELLGCAIFLEIMNSSEGSTALYIVILWEIKPGSKSCTQSATYSVSTRIRLVTGLLLTGFLL